MTAADLPRTIGQATAAIHAGQQPDPVTGAVVPPLYLASTYVMDKVGVPRAGYDYARSGNPTRSSLEIALAAVEVGERGFAFPSGMAAEDLLLRVLTRPGDSIGYATDVYGGTYRLFTAVLPAEGRTAVPVDLTELVGLRSALDELGPSLVWLETPSNPLLEIVDIQAIAQLVHDAGALLVVDNTFASPALQQPLTLGADIVVHSTTKSIAGHSDLVGGAVVVAAGVHLPNRRVGVSGSTLVGDELAYWQNATGSIASPHDCWLASRGLKTLRVRVTAAGASAHFLARHFDGHPQVVEVCYPGLASHPQHELATRQMRGYGSLLTLRFAEAEIARAVCESTRVFALAVSLGAVESLIEHPASMTHATKTDSPSAIADDMVRISVGLEDIEDLTADLEQAITTATGSPH
ncbi:MAG: PLP-dependent transferase [Propionibacteriaceae bacterium]|nr:PLP-dependent transferase [Propionibacteriaceae bacterium]